MATDSWALAVDEQEAAVKSVSGFISRRGGRSRGPGIIKTSTTAEKTDEEEKEDRAAQSLLNKLIRSNLVDNTNQVEVLQRDPNSPLMATVDKLNPQNLIAQSQSGTGKTAAFVLAMLSRVEPADRYPQCLCLSPTYELALQTGKVIEQMGKFYPELKLAYAVRGNKLERGQKISEQIVIGTPGTVLDWCSKLKREPLCLAQKNILFFFFEMVSLPCPGWTQTPGDSKTLSRKEKIYTQILFISQLFFFFQTRKTASWLAAELSKEGHQVALLSGEMMVEQRAAVIERFREGKEKVLVTTNVCARGIDVEQVSVVINFDLPVDKDGNPDNETYLHRIGRTGRFGKRGLAVNMVDSKHSMNILNRIQEHFNKKIERLDTDDLDEIEKIAN
uniref:RNA helicase n=1 Tax=Macaca nemestrina TaxID=9545 RepID=A0A2K6DGZ2_MACNE